MKILLLDDDKRLGRKALETLEAMQYEVIFVNYFKDGLGVIESESPPDLCFFDVSLDGEEKTGIDLARFAIKKSIPVVIYTVHSKDSKWATEAFEAGIPNRFFIDRNQMENEAFLDKLIEDAVTTYKLPVSQFDYLNYASRKIGVLPYQAGIRSYTFIGKDNIIFIESAPGERGKTCIHTDKGAGYEIIVGGSVGLISGQIRRVFYNIIMLDQTYGVNLEKITKLEGTTLYFTTGEHIPLSKTALQTLKKNNLIINVQH